MDRHAFALEQLEGRAFFSVLALLDAPLELVETAAQFASPQATTMIAKPFPHSFNVAGTYTHPLGNPDTGSQYLFTGSGKTTLLGSFTLTGTVQAPGLIANAHASGKLHITTAHGTIHLKVNGPPQDPGSLPSTLSFSIYRGTGSYLNSKGKGQIGVSASGTTGKFLFRFTPSTVSS